ncbi:MAG TPA: hypothetical protein VGG54_18820 [Trebonia sp.]
MLDRPAGLAAGWDRLRVLRASVVSIWLSARRWLAGKLVTLSCRVGPAAPQKGSRASAHGLGRDLVFPPPTASLIDMLRNAPLTSTDQPRAPQW